MHIDDLAALLKRYHEDRCTPEERRIVEEWYESLSTGKSAPSPTGASAPGEPEIASSLEKVWERLREEAMDAPPAPARVRWPWLSAAAAVLLLGAVYTLTKFTAKTANATRAEDTLLVATAPGEVRHLVLPDGTEITLNANSRLRYPKSFGNRQVQLVTGEAFFQVATDPKRPFTVEAAGTKTLVLGTSFNIRSYDRDTATVIALLTGKVSVNEPGKSGGATALEPGDVLAISRDGRRQKRRFENAEEVTSWEEKAMNFRDASFEDIAFEIANTYNVTLVNASSKTHWSYTGYFEHESIWEIIRTICITEHLDYRSDQGHIILVNKN